MAPLTTDNSFLHDDKKSPDFFGDACFSVIMAGFWFGWSSWLMDSRKSAATIFGLTVVCLLLLYITIRCAKDIAIGIFTVLLVALAAPFVISGIVLFFCLRLVVLILSPLCVTGGRPFFRPLSKGGHCRLCCKCEAIVNESRLLRGSPWRPTLPSEKHEFYTRVELNESKVGCHMCRLLFHSVSTFKETYNGVVTENSHDTTHTDKITLKIWMKKWLFESPELRMQLCGVSIITSRPLNVKWQVKERGMHNCNESLFTDSKDISKWANERIEKCLEHALCQNEFVPLSQKDYIPLRLLDVQDAADGTIRLISTAELGSETPTSYCALSHCWGRTVDIKLSSNNFEAMKSISIRTLPRNFQDAVTITKQLGARYLWIDSLCIVQDDAEEWEIQSTKMGLVYTNAKCVISATASKDSTGGCFQPKYLTCNDCMLQDAGTKVLTLNKIENTTQLPDLFKQLVDNAPLTTRAWAFQERYLASRTLHFCKGVVLFECNAVIASAHNNSEQAYSIKSNVQADGKVHSPSDVEQVEKRERKWSPPAPNLDKIMISKYRRAARNNWKRERKIRPEWIAQQKKQAMMLKASARLGTRGAFEFLWRFKGDTLAEKVEFNNSWFELVQQYSIRQLTFSTDKAMAIAGVAAFIQQNTGLSYAAGLWTEMLPFNLLWISSQKSKTRPIRSLPSWSWTSIDGKISHPLSFQEDATPNSYVYSQRQTEGKSFRSNWTAVKPLISSESLCEEEAVNGIVHKATLTLTGHLCKLDYSKHNVSFDISEQPLLGEMYCLPTLSLQNPELPRKTMATQVHGIILEKKPGFESRYERVGYFRTVDESSETEETITESTASVIEIV